MSNLALTRKMKLIIVVNELWFFLSHRLPIALAARDAGYEVHIASRSGTSAEIELLIQENLQFHPINFHRSSVKILNELKTLQELSKLYQEVQPSIAHHVTIKPILYGTLVARWVGGIQILNAISGLGGNHSLEKNFYYGGIVYYYIVKKFGFYSRIQMIDRCLHNIK